MLDILKGLDMDIVYALGKGSVLKDFELRMSLRSVEKYLSGYGEVWIIGERPEWLQNIQHKPLPDSHKISDTNIMRKIEAACQTAEITDEFAFFNDDHYLLHPFEAATFPYFHKGLLDTYVANRQNDGYGRRAANTLKFLKANNLPTKHFDIHTPIIYNKELFLKHVVNAVDWGNKDGFIIKSLYANALNIEGVEEEDNKMNHPPTSNIKVFSSFPHMKASVTRFLTEQFPEKSKFERTGI